ncbi:unnamed protein product [Rotaria sp. Silwood1]|nr:unnamed protein product [Rotaria sp. Silwood1]CAF1632605.1 unnamed protein product [Rotaria sp. Silwood1]CAF4977978.1 unnamed protein product [Rotaria sp. Silwood1]
MYLDLLILFSYFIFTNEKHFNGGSITWASIDPYDNDTSVVISITQTYSWTYPYVQCKNNVPITTTAFSASTTNLICMVDCSTDGGYSTAPINILTDCIWTSSALKMMTSTRSNNITLSAGAHFYLAYTGTAWAPLNDPSQAALQWSIVTFIDLRKRLDGIINTAPVAQFVSPQYAIVNRTTQITIPVSDANVNDDVRCRWSVYIPGYRRRKRSNEEKEHFQYQTDLHLYKDLPNNREMSHIREKRAPCGSGAGGGPSCITYCSNGCTCQCGNCIPALCTGSTCNLIAGCQNATVTTTTTTTIETIGTLRSTSSYPIRQAIDECGDICYPSSLPSSTTLSNCTITFTGPKAGIWYGIAIQVEDFIDTTSTTPLSSVPVHMLIYVLPVPVCSIKPIILPLTGCLEVQVGITISFNISAMNLCNSTIATLTDIVVSTNINGLTSSNLTSSLTNSSISYITFSWTPGTNQVGFQTLCFIAFTSENLQSTQYCVKFTVKNSADICVTTTISTSTTSSTSKTMTTTTSTTTTSATTSKTTTTTISTSTSATSTTSTISTTSTTSTTSASTTTSTMSTSSTSSTTSTTTTTSTISTTSTTSTTSTSQIFNFESRNNLSLLLGLGLGSGDDTAANDSQFACSQSSNIFASNGGPWGDGKIMKYCPPSTAICGFSLKLENIQEEGDDTAANEAKFECCTL